jgi:very-short-patch-repair endonuclease
MSHPSGIIRAMARPLPGRRRDIHELAMESHGVVTSEDLAGCGLPRSTVTRWCRMERLVRLAPRTYLWVDVADDRSHLAAALAACPTGVASHRSAGVLWGLDGIAEDLVEVTVLGNGRGIAWATFHRSRDLEGFEVAEVDGLRCTDPTRTLCDLGAVVDEASVERAVESALSRRLTTVSRLRWRAEGLARPGRRGPGTLRRILDRRPDRAAAAESELETRFLQCIRAGGLPAPERQFPVRLHSGRRVRLDAAWPEQRVFAELDGAAWHAGWEARRREVRRQTEVVVLGWRPLRFTWHDVVYDPDETAATVRRALVSSTAVPKTGTPVDEGQGGPGWGA